ncbi:TetR/AcrR family transcriptional regulator [Leptospira langatensis]|uniref:TetR/AcrR family transcriptional regulator n=1 Tax=Leptospira langatensis TaxID=2484983 RepID=A0A5F1ZUH5_9LEPT|nr:TetR/AcrR family transcriptional regulator [Leptospira langatensis]TGJ98838.1 TetR/AcrR family transcriptional regulator [Leptospira langatensis]TGL40595.1 TetR/AcrR family transcriptional regulator [Leptospira langatensis]
MDLGKEKLRLRILNGATSIFLDQGYAKTRMEDLASACKIAKKTLYQFFPNKDEVLKAAALHNQTGIAKRIRRIRLDRTSGFPKRMKKVQEELLDIAKPDHIFLRKELRDQIPEIWRIIRENRVELIDTEIAALLEEGKALGEIREDLHPDLLVMVLNACSEALSGQEGNPTDRREDVRELDNIILYGIIERGRGKD